MRAPAAPAAPPAIRIPFAPPPEEEGDAADTQAGVEKKFAANDTLGAVLAREGFGAATPNVIAALAKLVDPRSIRGGAEVHRAHRRRRHAGIVRVPAHAGAPVPGRGETTTRAAAHRWTARKLEATIEIKTAEAGGTVESSLYESVQKAGESTALVSLLVELFAWDVNFYIDTHPGDHWKVLIEKQYLGGSSTSTAACWRPSTAARSAPSGRSSGPARTRRAIAPASTTTPRARRCRRAC